MAKLEGREMTDEVLLDLVERFGLRVQKAWSSDLSETSILEAESPLLLYCILAGTVTYRIFSTRERRPSLITCCGPNLDRIRRLEL